MTAQIADNIEANNFDQLTLADKLKLIEKDLESKKQLESLFQGQNIDNIGDKFEIAFDTQNR